MVELAVSLAIGAGALLVVLGLPFGRRPVREGQPLRLPSPFLVSEAQLREAGLDRLTPAGLAAIAALTGLMAALLCLIALGWLAATVAAGMAGAIAPYAWVRGRAERRREAMVTMLPDAIDTLRGEIQGGRTPEQGIAFLAESGPELLRPLFALAAARAARDGLDSALIRAREELQDPTFDRVTLALAIASRYGSRNVSAVLEQLSRSLRDELSVRREVRAEQARNIWSARILAGIPLLMLVAMKLLNPEYAAAYGSPAGQMMLLLCFASIYLGYRLMMRVIELPREGRFIWTLR